MAKDVDDNKTSTLPIGRKLEISEIEAAAIRAAIRTQIKSHERAIRMHQTQGRNSMAEIYLEEGRILQNILGRV